MLEKINILGLYISLSGNGKRLFRRFARMLNNARSLSYSRELVATINDTMGVDKKKWFSCIRASDSGFKEFIPDWYIAGSKIKPEQLYYRFFKMGAVLLYEHSSLFLAYNISVDTKAKKRCILLAFLKRVYDDLIDNEHIGKDILFNSQPNIGLMNNADYRLFLDLRKKIREVASPLEFVNYYATLKEVNDAQGILACDKSVENTIPYKIKNGFLLDMYIMMNDLPDELIRALDVTAEFFACLDNFYDYDEDLAKGKITYINQSIDPKGALEQKFEKAAVYLRKNSPNPDGYLKGLGSLMKIVLFAREKKLNKLSSFV
ncbi:MAG: hypothetical protein NTZ63_03770 [Candidatus Omnitrophica bacterium]|nr:hypothetical protein [Candidatus Omnitrophota bacterium]